MMLPGMFFLLTAKLRTARGGVGAILRAILV